MEPIERFFYYINERHMMYLRRKNGVQYPWTSDAILTEYSFCNVYRELDRVTEWIRVNWREPYHDHSNLPFAMAVARQINWPDTLEEIGFPETWEPEKVKAIMQARKDRGDKVYTGAYMFPSHDQKAIKPLNPGRGKYSRQLSSNDQVFIVGGCLYSGVSILSIVCSILVPPKVPVNI